MSRQVWNRNLQATLSPCRLNFCFLAASLSACVEDSKGKGRRENTSHNSARWGQWSASARSARLGTGSLGIHRLQARSFSAVIWSRGTCGIARGNIANKRTQLIQQIRQSRQNR